VPETPPRLYVFDLDGTLRWTARPGAMYPLHAGDWRLMPNVARTLRAIRWGPGGARLAVASNQNGVGEGLLALETAEALARDALRAALGYVPDDLILALCTCRLDAGCDCRKPAPGLLVRALREAGVRPDEALFVGDLESDREAARRAGVPFRTAAEFFGWPA
jgi:D-glycero-D-manno-heptose 1,7-bisphosphate phosphatase